MAWLALIPANNSTGGYIEVFGLASPASGAQTVAYTSGYSGSPNGLIGGSLAYTGTGTTTATAFGTPATTFGQNTSGSVSVTGASASNRVAGFFCDGTGSQAVTAGTQRYLHNLNTNSGAGNSFGADIVSAAGTVTISGSWTNDWWGAVGVEVLSAPLLVYSNLQSTSSAATLTSTSFTPQTGDIIVVKLDTADASTNYNTPTGGGWTYTQQVLDTTTSHVWASIWTAPVTSGGTSQTVASTHGTGSTTYAVMVVELWRGAQLAATPATCDTRGTGAPSTTLTTVAANSVVSWMSGDWAGVDGTSRAYITSSATPTEDGYSFALSQITAYSAYQTTATAGSQNLGLTAPTGQTWTLTGIEIQAATSSAFGATGSFLYGSSTTGGTLAVNNQGVGNLLLVVAITEFSGATVTCTGLSGGGATWTEIGTGFLGVNNTGFYAQTFAGTVTATGTGSVTPSFSGTPSLWELEGHEFTVAGGVWSLDVRGNLDAAFPGQAAWPSLTPATDRELYFGYAIDSSVGSAGTTSGYVYSVNSANECSAYNLSCAVGVATHPVWANTTEIFGGMVLMQAGASPPSITTTSLPSAFAGSAYSTTVVATGGTTPYTWSISSGSLPGWASLNSSTGVISGTPANSDAGITSFTIKVTDNASLTATQPLTLTVVPEFALRPAWPGYPAPSLFVPGLLTFPPTVTNASITTTVLTGSVAFPARTVVAVTKITTTVLNGTVTFPAPVVTSRAAVTTAVLNGTVSFPASTVTAVSNASITTTVLNGTVTFPAPAVVAKTAITTAVLNGTVVFPAVTVTAQTAIAASSLAGTVTFPAPAVTAVSNASITTAVLNGTVSFGAVVSEKAAVTTSVLNGSVTFPAPVVTSNANPTISVLNGSVSFPSVVVTVSASITPTTLTGSVSFASPTIVAVSNASIITTVLAGSVSFPAPAISAGGSVNITPSVFNGSVSFPAPVVTAVNNANIAPAALTTSVSFSSAVHVNAAITTAALTATSSFTAPAVAVYAAVTSTVFNGTVTFPAPVVSVKTAITSAVLAVTTSFPAPGITAVSNAAITTVTFTGSVSFPAPSVTAGGNANITPSVLNGTVSFPASSVTAVTVITATVLNGSVTFPASSVFAQTKIVTAALVTQVGFTAPAVAVNASVITALLHVTTVFNGPLISSSAALALNSLAVNVTFPLVTVLAGKSVYITPGVLLTSVVFPKLVTEEIALRFRLDVPGTRWTTGTPHTEWRTL
jgi:hypothetical protein